MVSVRIEVATSAPRGRMVEQYALCRRKTSVEIGTAARRLARWCRVEVALWAASRHPPDPSLELQEKG
jgi:hypothetical protein